MAGRVVKIHLENVGMTYRIERTQSLNVFRQLNADIYEHEFVAIIGPSGCGKTTLISLIAGLLLPTEGRVMADGQEVTKPGRDRGVVFQQDSVFMWRTVIENVAYGLEMRGIARQQRRDISRDYLKLVGLEPYANFYPKELSGGMRKRVQLATVFANSPSILLMDEPFGSLDYPTKCRLQRELLEMWERNRTTTVFITHDLEEAIFLADRILTLRDGTIDSTFDVPFSRPRTDDLRVSPEIQKIKSMLWHYLEPLEAKPKTTAAPGGAK